jgi:hypothetical protein
MMNIDVSFVEGGLQDCLICGILEKFKCRPFSWFCRPFSWFLIFINLLKSKLF